MSAASAPVMQMPLVELLSLTDSTVAESNVMIRGVQTDSRKVVPGDLFIAVPGEVHDGRQFIEQAVASGAVAVVAEPPVAGFIEAIPVPLLEQVELAGELGFIVAKFYQKPSDTLAVVGVTGTNGKTTTSWLTAQLIRSMGKTCGVIGTLGSTLSDNISDAGNTTPDAVTLQRRLADWRDKGVEAVCMEVSSHALVQGRANGVTFAAAVFTNLSRDHLDYHGTMEAYGRAKMQLFTAQGLPYAIVNLDDSYSAKLLAAASGETRALTYSANGNAAADVVISNAVFSARGIRAYIRSPWGDGEITSPLAGDFNLANLAAAITTAATLTDNFSALLDAVADLQTVPGRMQLIPNALNMQLIVDYAHTPDALEQVLLAIRPHVSGQLITVFGCGGDRDAGKRSVMGRVACEHSDRCVVTSDNPRGENPTAILHDIEAGCTGNYQLVVDRALAIEKALDSASAGDCVLVAGKGHEDYQIVGAQRLHFSDEEQILKFLAKRGET